MATKFNQPGSTNVASDVFMVLEHFDRNDIWPYKTVAGGATPGNPAYIQEGDPVVPDTTDAVHPRFRLPTVDELTPGDEDEITPGALLYVYGHPKTYDAQVAGTRSILRKNPVTFLTRKWDRTQAASMGFNARVRWEYASTDALSSDLRLTLSGPGERYDAVVQKPPTADDWLEIRTIHGRLFPELEEGGD
jgi:hypothetical protein